MDTWMRQFFNEMGIPVVEDLNEVLDEKGIIVIDIERPFVERKVTGSLVNQLKKSGKEFRSRLLITFNGYHDDPREVYQIPEIRKWVRSVYKQVPHLFYFLAPELEGMKPIFLCIANEIYSLAVDNNPRLASIVVEADKLVKELILNALKFSLQMNETKEERRQLIQTILNGLDLKEVERSKEFEEEI